jgi:hypothetical protein
VTDPLEAELRSLRPQPLSPAMRRRLGDRLTAAPAGRRRHGLVALTGSLAASALALATLLRFGAEPPAPPAREAATLPTVQAYRQAFARSPEALDELLDRHSAGPARAAAPTVVAAFRSELPSLRGLR